MEAHTTSATLLTRLAHSRVGESAWNEFLERYGDLIKGYARARGAQSADCDDICQDVLLSFNKAVEGGAFSYDPNKGRFRSYLKAATVRALAARSRQNGPGLSLEGFEGRLEDESDGLWEQQWRQHHTRLAMKTVQSEFNATDLEAFQRYAVMQQPAAEVARALGISVESVYQAKTRVLRRLSRAIEQQIAEEG